MERYEDILQLKNDVRCVFIFHFRKTIYLQCTFYDADGVAYYLEKASLFKGSEVATSN
jgi:hypothetical protein